MFLSPLPKIHRKTSFVGVGTPIGPDALYPAPDFMLDFGRTQINPVVGGGTTSVTSSANGTYRNSAGLVVQNTSNNPRFDYDHVTGRLLGLLIEEARDNRCLQNRDKSQAVWTKTSISVSAATNWSGASTNIRLTATGANGTCLQAITNASVARTYSVAIKRVTGTGTINITLDNGTTWTDVTSQINSSTFTVVSATQTLANPTVGVRIVTSGDVIDVDLDQEETGAFRTSPIPTTVATVNRAADAYSIALGVWYNAAAGIFLCEFINRQTQSSAPIVLGVDDGTNSERIQFFMSAADDPSMFVVDGGVIQVNSPSASPVVNGVLARVAYAYAQDDFNISTNGAALVPDTGGTLPTVTTLRIGNGVGGVQHLNGWFKEAAYWGRRRLAQSDAFLRDLSKSGV